MEAACEGKYDFLKHVQIYSQRSNEIKSIFQKYGFELVYDKDMDAPISDGFYFTICKKGVSGHKLLFEILVSFFWRIIRVCFSHTT